MKFITTNEQKKFLLQVLTDKDILEFSDREYIQGFLKNSCGYYYEGIRIRINKIMEDNGIDEPIKF